MNLLAELFQSFPNTAPPQCDEITAVAVPLHYRELLVHTFHMTVTVEAFYQQPVDVSVLETSQHENWYARQIVLKLRHNRAVVQYGLVRIDLDCLIPQVRQRILAGAAPLGRILIEEGVLRHIEPAGYFHVTLNPQFQGWLNTPIRHSYGRLGVIHTDGRPAITEFELLTPVDYTAT